MILADGSPAASPPYRVVERSRVYCDDRGPTRWGECAGCGGDLPRRPNGAISHQRVWCSDACVRRWQLDHDWQMARAEALRRADHSSGWRWVENDDGSTGWGIDPDGSRGALCARCGARSNVVEVDHVVPREGRGYRSGCWHHQSNLQVLCRPCHVTKGIIWRAVMRALERARRPLLEAGGLTLWR